MSSTHAFRDRQWTVYRPLLDITITRFTMNSLSTCPISNPRYPSARLALRPHHIELNYRYAGEGERQNLHHVGLTE